VVEDKQVKLEAFARLADVVDAAEAVLASNTSSIPIVELAAAAGNRAGRVLGLHFFNPVPVMNLVEVIPSLLTSKDAVGRTRDFASSRLGKESIVAPDRAGGSVVDRFAQIEPKVLICVDGYHGVVLLETANGLAVDQQATRSQRESLQQRRGGVG
jgi:3-hydroxyacyl-CoA dehydrogenase